MRNVSRDSGVSVRQLVFAVSLAALFAATSSAARFGPRLDAFEAEMQSRTDALVGDLTKPEKKDKKLYDGALKKLAKDSDSLKGDIKLAKKSIVKVEKKKPGDATIDALKEDAVMGLAGDVSDHLDAVQADLDGFTSKVKAASVQKAIDKGRAKLTDAAGQTKTAKRLAKLIQAEAQAAKADRLFAKLSDGGGGGGGGGGGAFQAYLKASNSEADDDFGFVAIDGDTLVVTARAEDSSASGVNGNQNDNAAVDSGAAYVFVRSGTTWTQQAYLKTSNPDSVDFLGAVAISGNTIVVGCAGEDSNAQGVDGDQSNDSELGSGAAYVFVRNGTTWTQQAYLKASNTDPSDFFGSSVSISGDTIVVGSSSEDGSASGVNQSEGNGGDNRGAAYVFVRNGTTWTQQAYLKASNSGDLDNFGARGAVAVSGDTIAVGAFQENSDANGVNGDQNNEGATNSGAVYVFSRSGVTWTQQAYLKASNDTFQFGLRVALSGDTLVVGTPQEQSNATGVNGNENNTGKNQAGAAYVFHRVGTTWSQQAYLKASNTDDFDRFGSAVGISGDLIAIGAPSERSGATGLNGNESDDSVGNAGAVYLFTRTGTTWGPGDYVKASNTDAEDRFGDNLAVSGTTILIAARGDDSSATGVDGDDGDNSLEDSGAAYVLVK